jgi:hypothetical protein
VHIGRRRKEEEEKHHRMRFENTPKWQQQKHQCI